MESEGDLEEFTLNGNTPNHLSSPDFIVRDAQSPVRLDEDEGSGGSASAVTPNGEANVKIGRLLAQNDDLSRSQHLYAVHKMQSLDSYSLFEFNVVIYL